MNNDLVKSKENKNLEKNIQTRLEVNIEKTPFIAFYNWKNKKKIEQKIRESKGGIEVYTQELLNGTIRSIKMDVSMSYGMPISEDQDVWVVIASKINENHFKNGKVEETIEIDMDTFAEIMQKTKTGKFYKFIEDSLNRLAGISLYHHECFQAKDKEKEKSTLEYDAQKGLKIINSVTILKIKRDTKRVKNVVRLEIPKWIRNNYDNYYTTNIDLSFYFTLPKGRTRRLYRLLDIYRHAKSYFLDYNRCDSVLCLNMLKDRYKRNEKIKMALKELKLSGYIEDYDFEDYGIKIMFTNVKKAFAKSLTRKLSESEEDALEFLIDYVQEPESENYYRKIVRDYRPESVARCIDLTEETIKNEGIKKTKASIFVYHLNKYGDKK